MNQLENIHRAKEIAAKPVGENPERHNSEASTPIFLGILALIAGWFFFGVPFSLVAIHQGRKAVAYGAKIGGRILLIAAWSELILTIVAIFIAP